MSTRLERRLAAKRAKQHAIRNFDGGEWEHRIQEPILMQTGQLLQGAWLNDRFSVQKYAAQNGWAKLMIRSHDSAKLGWAELQKIKTQLFGAESRCLQMFPKESELTDVANMYWLWLAPDDFIEPWEPKP